MNISKPIVFGFLAFALAFSPAHADTDYSCLKTCHDTGRAASVCLTQCAYGPSEMAAQAVKPPERLPGKMPPQPEIDHRCLNQCFDAHLPNDNCLIDCSFAPQAATPGGAAGKISPHEQFQAPVPADGAVILNPSIPTVHPADADDYSCLARCRASGLQTPLCEQRCTSPEGH